MRRPGRALAAFTVLALAVACSKQEQGHASQDARDASQSARQAVTNVGRDPAVKRAGADLRLIGHEAAVGVRHMGSQADAALHHLAASNDRATRDRDDHTNRATDSSNS
jgi:hypothetical protein